MILYDPSIIVNYLDYGIMLPIPPDRGNRVLEFLNGAYTVLATRSAKIILGCEKQVFNREDLERVHSKDYIANLYGDGLQAALLSTFELIDANGNPFRYEPDRAVKPLSDLFNSLTAQAEGTYLESRLALSHGFCFYLGGGMHHARYDKGSGFCLINDAAAAAIKILSERTRSCPSGVSLVWIIDLDAHKGDGTAELISFARERGELRAPCEKSANAISPNNKPCILTLSIHMAKGWPLDEESLLSAKKDRAPLLPSDVDIGIDTGEEAEYTSRLADGIRKLESLSGRMPDFAVVVDGADPYEHDALPSSSLLRLTLDQCIERDTYVYRCLKERKIPSAWIQSGGYGERAWEPPAHFLKSIKQI